MSRGVKTPQTIKEGSSVIHNQTTPRAHAASNKNFRSQEVNREQERQMNEFNNQFGAQMDGNGSFGGINNNNNNKHQMMLQAEEQINNMMSMNQQNISGGSFNSNNDNNAGMDQGILGGVNNQMMIPKQKIVIGQHGAPRVQTTYH